MRNAWQPSTSSGNASHEQRLLQEFSKRRQGFSVIELIVIISLIGILFAVVLLALNPPTRLGTTRDAERRQAVHDILHALVAYGADNFGNVPSVIDSLTASVQIIGTNASGCTTVGGTCAGYTQIENACANITGLVDAYLTNVPTDPTTGTSGNARYYVQKSYNNRLEVGACDPEQTASIVERR